jgi:quinolinate synthase
MFRTDPQHLAWILDNLVEGHVVNRIRVAEDQAGFAKLALERMLAVA